ncbi:collagen, type I, alpha 1a-like [Passer domesticus]|uniref:collagen, type I, alpha 1a-like n=1 Tax=Passer domesticus TaxID=48849 RepID=UPI0030FEE4C7
MAGLEDREGHGDVRDRAVPGEPRPPRALLGPAACGGTPGCGDGSGRTRTPLRDGTSSAARTGLQRRPGTRAGGAGRSGVREHVRGCGQGAEPAPGTPGRTSRAAPSGSPPLPQPPALPAPPGPAAPGTPGSSRSRSPGAPGCPLPPAPQPPALPVSQHREPAPAGREGEGGSGTHRGGAGGGAAAPHPPPPLCARPGPCGPFIPRRGRHRPQPAGAPPGTGTGTGTAGTAPGTSTGTGSSSARKPREPAPHRQYLAPAPAPHCGSDDRHRRHRRHRHQQHQRCTGTGTIAGITAPLLHRQRLRGCTGTGIRCGQGSEPAPGTLGVEEALGRCPLSPPNQWQERDRERPLHLPPPRSWDPSHDTHVSPSCPPAAGATRVTPSPWLWVILGTAARCPCASLTAGDSQLLEGPF